MAFPHPKPREEHDRKEDKSRCGGVIGNDFKRTIDVTDYWNAADDVNPAKDRPFGAIVHGWFVLHLPAIPRHYLRQL